MYKLTRTSHIFHIKMLKIIVFICFTVNFLEPPTIYLSYFYVFEVDSIPVYESVIEGRILGGNDTDITKAPYMVAEFELNTFMCGAFIVSSSYIVSSASCLVGAGPEEVFIRAGSSYNKKDGVIVKAKKIHLHPKYHIRDYNVGIIELASPLKLNDKTMKPLKLATKEASAGSVVFVSGWGFTSTNLDRPEILQSITVPIFDRTKCEKIYKPKNVTITSRMICGTPGGPVPVFGDAGGPAVYKDEAVGIVSFGIGEFPRSFPTVYTNIADPEITKFIKDIVKF